MGNEKALPTQRCVGGARRLGVFGCGISCSVVVGDESVDAEAKVVRSDSSVVVEYVYVLGAIESGEWVCECLYAADCGS